MVGGPLLRVVESRIKRLQGRLQLSQGIEPGGEPTFLALDPLRQCLRRRALH